MKTFECLCRLSAAVALIIVGLSCRTVLAHHAASAVFTDETIEVEGYVTEFNLRNPHMNFYFTVTDGQGVETLWMATGPAVPPLQQLGWTADTIREGQYLRIRGKKARRDRPMILVSGRELFSGQSILELDQADGSVIGPVIDSSGSSPDPQVDISLPLTLPDGRPNLSGVWFGGLGAAITGRSDPPLNEAAAERQATFNPLDDPVFATCSNEPGLVRQAATILPRRITQNEDHVLIEYEGFAGRRVIFLDGRAAESGVHARFGHHVARYEDDSLVIETTQLLANLTGPDGNALSDQTTTVETYRRADGSDTGPLLEMSMVVTDPGHLTEPWTIITRTGPAEDDYQFADVECEVPLPGPAENEQVFRG